MDCRLDNSRPYELPNWKTRLLYKTDRKSSLGHSERKEAPLLRSYDTGIQNNIERACILWIEIDTRFIDYSITKDFSTQNCNDLEVNTSQIQLLVELVSANVRVGCLKIERFERMLDFEEAVMRDRFGQGLNSLAEPQGRCRRIDQAWRLLWYYGVRRLGRGI